MPARDPRDYPERRDKKPFWAWDRSKDADRDRDRPGRDRGRDFQRKDDEAAASLAKMIGKMNCITFLETLSDSLLGYLTATASEDWGLVLDVCERASASEINAKEAVKTLRREFKCVVSNVQTPSPLIHIADTENQLINCQRRGSVILLPILILSLTLGVSFGLSCSRTARISSYPNRHPVNSSSPSKNF